MSGPEETREHLLQHIKQLEMRLEEAESTLQAIRHGEVDALRLESDWPPGLYAPALTTPIVSSCRRCRRVP